MSRYYGTVRLVLELIPVSAAVSLILEGFREDVHRVETVPRPRLKEREIDASGIFLAITCLWMSLRC